MEKEKPQLLIVDDVAQNIQILGNILSPLYIIEFAQSGEAALKLISKRKFDMILLDIMMPPGMNGIETLKKIRKLENGKNTPVIFITARNDIETIKQCFASGAVDYIQRPLIVEELKARLQTHFSLHQSHQELQRKNQLKDQLISVVAHDLKDPLNNIRGLSEMLVKNAPELAPELQQQYIEMIYSSSDATLKMLNNLLEWVFAQTGRLKISFLDFALYHVVQDAILFFDKSIQKKNITVENQIDKTIQVYADPEMIATVFRNLISNAIKYGKKNGWIKISAKAISEQQKIEVKISDNGIGIPEKLRGEIFNTPFIKSGHNHSQGTGLGLAIVKEFVALNKGEISVESTKDEGTVFTFVLNTPA